MNVIWKKLTDVDVLSRTQLRWTPERCAVVWVNGCFDLLHAGHVAFLRAAREFGDVLVVGINSDESVRRLKGASRPIISLRDRVGVLLDLESVDYVVRLDGDEPCEAVAQLRPDVLVKSEEYRPGGQCPCPEAKIVEGYGGRVEYLPRARDVSTSAIIRRIQALGMGGQL